MFKIKQVFMAMAILLAVALITGCSEESNADQQDAKGKAFSVKTQELQPRPFAEYLQLTGTTKARNHVDIIVEEGGTIETIKRDKGTYVKKGETLALLTNLVIKASYDEATAALNQAKLNYTSNEVLFKKKAISENEFLSAKYQLDRAQAMYNLANARYSKLFIKAPISGYVNDRYYDYGAYAMPMSRIFTLVDNSELKIRAGVAGRFLADIRVGTQAEITFDAYPDMKIDAVVSFISKSINPQNRTFEIELKIPNKSRKLAPEMIVNIRLLRRSYENKIVIPLDALIDSETGRHVFLFEDSKAAKRDVEVLAVYEDSVLVEGLANNQQLIVLGHRELSEGDAVKVIE